MSKYKGLLLALSMLVVTGVMTPSAFALPKVVVSLLSLGCYQVSKAKTGNWNKQGSAGNLGPCAEQATTHLVDEWVEAEPLSRVAGSTDLWCAKLTPYKLGTTSETGEFSEALCLAKKSNGEYTEVNVPGNGDPLHLNYENAQVKSELETTAGGLLEGEGLKVLSLSGESGTFRVDIFEVRDGTRKCNTVGDKAPTVLVEGSFHLVYTSLSPLYMGVLDLPNEVTIECEGTNLKIKGDTLASLNAAGSDETELNGTGNQLKKGSTAGKPAIEEYYNDEGVKVKAKLETTTGGTTKESSLIVDGEPNFTALEGKMFVITSR